MKYIITLLLPVIIFGCATPKSEIAEFLKSDTRQGGQKFEGDAAEITAQVVDLLANEAKVF